MTEGHCRPVDNSPLPPSRVTDAGVPDQSISFQNLADFLEYSVRDNLDISGPAVRSPRVPHPSIGLAHARSFSAHVMRTRMINRRC